MVMPHAMQIEALRTAPDDFRRVIKPLPSEALTWHPGEEWAIAQTIAHLAYIELFSRQRFRHIVDASVLLLDLDSVSELSPETPVSNLLEQWRIVRVESCDWLATLPLATWNRPVDHLIEGKVTLRSAVQRSIKHDMEHLAQITNLRQAWEARQK